MIGHRDGKVIKTCDGCFEPIQNKGHKSFARARGGPLHFHNRACADRYVARGDDTMRHVTPDEVVLRQAARTISAPHGRFPSAEAGRNGVRF